MVAKKWEQYLWEELHIVPVQDFNKGRVRLLDIFAQDGRSYRLRNIVPGADDGKPFRRRALTRIGSMINLGDEGVQDWLEDRKELSDQLLALEQDDNHIVDEPFTKGFDGPDRTFKVGAESKFLASLFDFVAANIGKSAALEIQIRSPVYQRVAEDGLVGFLDDADPKWKPDLRKIEKVKRKGVSIFCGGDEKIELWIVTELKFGTINCISRNEVGVGASVKIPGAAELATVLPVEGSVSGTYSVVGSRQIAEAPANTDDILYGFKAVRVTFDKQGKYVSRRGDMGKTTPHVTRAGEELGLNPDTDPEYHMSAFFATGDEDHSSGDFECIELLLDDIDITEDDISSG